MTRTRLRDTEFVAFMALVSAMGALAIDMLLPAFSDMRPDFGLAEDSPALGLTLTLFFIGSGIGQLVLGPLADAVGRKPVMVASMTLYGLGALASALAPTLGFLYAARFAWGVAAAGPRVLSQAIVRDRYQGDDMARVMSLIQAIFFLGPVVAPIIGAGLVAVGSWRWVMAFGVASAAVVLAWSTRLEETLSDQNRRAFQIDAITSGFSAVFRNRTTTLYALSVSFSFASIFAFLGSVELIVDDVFDRAGIFVPLFSVLALGLGLVAFTTNRLLQRTPGRVLALRAGVAMLAASAVLAAIALAGEGEPNFWLWIIVFGACNGANVAYFPVATSLAMEPMGEQAGTAAAVIGFISAVIGSVLGGLVDRAFDGSVTPLSLSFVAFTGVSLVLQLWARKEMAEVDGNRTRL